MDIERDQLLSKLRGKIQDELTHLRESVSDGPGEETMRKRKREKEQVHLARELAAKTAKIGTTSAYVVLDTAFGYVNKTNITWRLTPAFKNVVGVRLMYYKSYEGKDDDTLSPGHFCVHFQECYNSFNRAVANGCTFGSYQDSPDRYAPLFVVNTENGNFHVPDMEIQFSSILPHLGTITMPWSLKIRPQRLVLHLEFKVLNVLDEDQNSKIHS